MLSFNSGRKISIYMVKEDKNMILTVVLTGPESSGKTTLARALAGALDTILVPEFSRTYLQYLARKYDITDLPAICSGQKSWQEWYGQQCKKSVLICDTDWTVIRIWEQFQFGTKHVTNAEMLAPNTHYFLCAPDMPWAPDPLRENPTDRDELFELYHQLLLDMKANFSILSGTHDQRLSTALDQISKIL